MYRSSPPSLSCPQCQTPLGEATCSACGGVWIDAAESVAVLQGRADPPKARVEVAIRRTGGEVPRPCARCGATMSPYVFGGVTLDTCPGHGIWFDADELAEVIEAARNMKELADEDALSAEDVWSAAKIIVGGITLPFRVVAAWLVGA